MREDSGDVVVCRGAEAHIIKCGSVVVKARIHKSYRIPEIDRALVKQRTKHELKILAKLKDTPFVPALLEATAEVCGAAAALGYSLEDSIVMEYVGGSTLLAEVERKKDLGDLLQSLGVLVSSLHARDVVHGDLTLTNVIVSRDGSLRVVDFGLSFISTKDEDKAVDLYLLERAMAVAGELRFGSVLEGYLRAGSRNVVCRLDKVRKRGRKREMSAIG